MEKRDSTGMLRSSAPLLLLLGANPRSQCTLVDDVRYSVLRETQDRTHTHMVIA
eukprot:SAG22_NODE_8752_length_632_cov_1.542214_1_plen_54_part_00